MPLRVPALRERSSDIPRLVTFFVQKCAAKLGKQIETVSDEAMQQLASYAWPGNVRELQNVIERAVILSPSQTLVLAEKLRGPTMPARNHPLDAAQSQTRDLGTQVRPQPKTKMPAHLKTSSVVTSKQC